FPARRHSLPARAPRNRDAALAGGRASTPSVGTDLLFPVDGVARGCGRCGVLAGRPCRFQVAARRRWTAPAGPVGSRGASQTLARRRLLFRRPVGGTGSPSLLG